MIQNDPVLIQNLESERAEVRHSSLLIVDPADLALSRPDPQPQGLKTGSTEPALKYMQLCSLIRQESQHNSVSIFHRIEQFSKLATTCWHRGEERRGVLLTRNWHKLQIIYSCSYSDGVSPVEKNSPLHEGYCRHVHILLSEGIRGVAGAVMNVAGLHLVGSSSCSRRVSDSDSDKCVLSLPPRFFCRSSGPFWLLPDEAVMSEDFEAALGPLSLQMDAPHHFFATPFSNCQITKPLSFFFCGNVFLSQLNQVHESR